MAVISSRNPAKNYEPLGEVDVTPNSGIIKKVRQANDARESWRQLGVAGRTRHIRHLYDVLRHQAEPIVLSITREVGMPITVSRDEVAWDWDYFSWFMDNAAEILAPETTYEDEDELHQIRYEPIGSTAVITPWNLPFDLFVWGVIPALLAGNTVVYKAAEECALTGKLLEEVCAQAGLPDGVLSFIHGTGEQGAFLARQDVDLLWFTGSSEVGKQLYELAGKKFIKAVLEMGGSNPAIVFADADLDTVVNRVMAKRYSFTGQTCDAIKRLIVQDEIYDQLVSRLRREVAKLSAGDPEDPATAMGSLVSQKQLEALKDQVDASVQQGASVIASGVLPSHLAGAYYPPVIMTGITPSMPVWNEEVFGPVLPVMKFTAEAEAVQLANNTAYGLGAQIFTGDLARASRLAGELQAGSIDINGSNHFKPYNPFGGYKQSGIGREHGEYGLRELCQVKVVSLAKPKQKR